MHVKQSAIQSGFLIFQIVVVKLSGRGAVLGKGKEESAGSGGVLRTLHDTLPYAPVKVPLRSVTSLCSCDERSFSPGIQLRLWGIHW